MSNFKIIQHSSCPIRTKWKKNSANISFSQLLSPPWAESIMEMKSVENKKID